MKDNLFVKDNEYTILLCYKQVKYSIPDRKSKHVYSSLPLSLSLSLYIYICVCVCVCVCVFAKICRYKQALHSIWKSGLKQIYHFTSDYFDIQI